MSSLEKRPDYAYSLADCLQELSFPYSSEAEVDERIRFAINDAYESASIHPDFILDHPMQLNRAIAAIAITRILGRYDIRLFATLMKLSNDEEPVDHRLVQWRDLGPFEGTIRRGLIMQLEQQYEMVEAESDSNEKYENLSRIGNAVDRLHQIQTSSSKET